jgi:hypothetical protein
MKWIHPKYPPGPSIGDKKIETRFLVFPMTLENKEGYKETRWLEKAIVEFEWGFSFATEGGGSYYDWIAKKWAN